jgi:hypothetical protein
MAITTYDGIIASRAAGKADDPLWSKTATWTGAAGIWYSMHNMASGTVVAMVAASVNQGAVMDATNVGAIPLQSTTGTDSKYLLTVGINSTLASVAAVMIVDVLWEGTDLFASSATLQTIASDPLTRYTSGVGNYIVMVPSVNIAGSYGPATLTYIDSNNALQSITRTLAARVIGRCDNSDTVGGLPWLAPTLSTGVKSIVTFQNGLSTTTGRWHIMIVHPLLVIPTIAAYTYVERDSTIQIDGILNLPVASYIPGCLTVFCFCDAAAATPTLFGTLRTCSG